MRSIVISLLVGSGLGSCLPAPSPALPFPVSKSVSPSSGIAGSLPSCNPSAVVPPTAPTPLPSPPAGSVLSLVAIGRGTQNYTCADSSNATIPVQIGAEATLYDASCLAVRSVNELGDATRVAQKFSISQVPSQVPVAGHHFFPDATTPAFDMARFGLSDMKKISASAAPTNTNGDVPWLLLEEKGTTPNSPVKAVYRLQTAGGAAPKTCEGQGSNIEVQYAATYWFYT